MSDKDKAHKDDKARIDRENEEQIARTDGMQPTPTQAENDRAKLGVNSLKDLDDKEADGSPEERDVAAGDAAAYKTRAAKPSK